MIRKVSVDIALTIIICILLLALLYVILNYKMVRTVGNIFKTHYQNQIQSDVQDFYRELENYTVIFENRIQRFKKLLDRQDKNIEEWKGILSSIKTTKKAKEIIEKVNEMVETNAIQNKKSENDTSLKPSQETDKAPPPIKKAAAIPDTDDTSALAEEVISDMLAKEPADYHSQTQRQEAAPQKDINVMKFLAKLGGSVSKSFLEEAGSEGASTKTLDQAKPPPTADFSKLIRKEIAQKPVRPLVSEEPEAPSNTPANAQAEEKPPKKSEALLSADDIIILLQDLSNSKKKPMALQVLMRNGFSVSDIAEMSEIPHNDLETTRSIYGF